MNRVIGACTVGVTAALLSSPCFGSCSNARIVSTVFPAGAVSYMLTPGVEVSSHGSSLTREVRGSFWALGFGDPASGKGHDNGAFPALDGDLDGWIQLPAGYPATLHGSWAVARSIDGCIDEVTNGATCMAVLLSDQHGARGYFALLTAAGELGNYSFAQPANAPIVLAPIPAPEVLATTATQIPNVMRASVRVGSMLSGLYLDPQCSGNAVAGYKVYQVAVARGQAVSEDRTRTSTTAGWRIAEGGEQTGNRPILLGETTELTLRCEPETDIYLTASLVFDSGFETVHLSEDSRRIPCGP